MKNLKFYSILGLSALLMLSACDKDEPAPDSGSPVLTLDQTTLTVSGEGGVVSVNYQVENPVEGATVSVDLGGVTWITDVTVTDSTIDLTIEANSENDLRTATFTVSYPGAEDVSLTVVQEAVVAQYDYEHTLEDFTGFLYYEYGYYFEDMYYIWLSDIGFDDEGQTQAGGHYYNFALLVEENTGKTLPTGTYTYTPSFYGDYALSGLFSRYVEQGSDDYTQTYFSDGYINVSADGDTYTIEGVVTDENGAVHRVYYNGPAVVKDFALEEDVDFTATTVVATYYYDYEDVMNVDIVLTDMVYESAFVYYPPGYRLTLDTCMPFDEDGKIAVGTYEVNTTYNSMTIYPGYYSHIYKYVTYNDYTYDYITSGTMTVTAGSEEDYYDISCEFETEDGFTVKCTYSGYLVVDGIPGPASTITEDITLDLEGAVGIAYDFGNLYGNGGKNWFIFIDPPSGVGGDGMMLDINSTWGDTIPTETYTPYTTYPPAIGEYVPGSVYYGSWYSGVWYFEYDEIGFYVQQAPAISGDISFINNGDGTHTLDFECQDGDGHTWSGTWTGTFTVISDALSSVSTSSISTGNRSVAISKFSKQEISAKIAEMRDAKNKAAQSDMVKLPVSAKESRTNTVSKTFEKK